MFKTIFYISILAICSEVSAQSSFGIQINMGNSVLNQISNDSTYSYGYAGADYNSKSVFFISPSLRFRKSINSKISFEIGLGYIPLHHQIELKYYYELFQSYIDTTLEIDVKYLSIPIIINFSFPISPNSGFLLSPGFNTNLLLTSDDNFEDLILEEIAWVKRDWYTNLIFAFNISLSYSINFKSSQILELGLFASKDLNSFIKQMDVWGFYNNLNSSKNFQYGLQLKYFINTKSNSL